MKALSWMLVGGLLLWSTAVFAAEPGKGAAAKAKPAAGNEPAGEESEDAEPGPPPTPSLDGVTWLGPATNLDALRGKTVLLLSYVTWCPICNEWAPELFSQIKEATKDKPIVVIAVATETPTVSGAEYMTKKNFFGPNIFHGEGPTINAQMGLKKANLFNYAIIDQTGKIVDRGSAGTYVAGKGKKEFWIPLQLAQLKNLGTFDAIVPEQSDSVKQALWPVELGQVTSDAVLSKARATLKGDDQKEFDAAIDRFLQSRVANIEQLAAGDVPQQIDAYRAADLLSKTYRTRPQAEPAKKLLVELNRDVKFKRELAAKQAYDMTQKQANALPIQRANLLRSFSTRFKGTHYGDLAAQELTAQ